jgi:NADPH-dependent curcumin reductase CurA
MSTVNHQIRLAARPVGLPTAANWQLTEEPIPTAGDGQIVVSILYSSLDPAMRGWMNEGKSYIAPVGIGDVMRAGGAGRVIESKNPKFLVGEFVTGMFGVQEFALSDGRGVNKVNTSIAPLPAFLGTLGAPGMTAYFGLLDIGKPQPGQTVVVSGAAGAVGTVVGQIAKIKGCRAVGIAGGADKCQWIVNDLGFDAAIDYKSEDVKAALRVAAPSGVDVYFDNVGGEILDIVLTQINRSARIIICGAISQYNSTTGIKGPANYLSLLVNRASMTGMVVFDYADRYAEAGAEMAGWLTGGKLKSREQVTKGGVAAFPDTLLMLFRGENTGKLVLEVTAAE